MCIAATITLPRPCSEPGCRAPGHVAIELGRGTRRILCRDHIAQLVSSLAAALGVQVDKEGGAHAPPVARKGADAQVMTAAGVECYPGPAAPRWLARRHFLDDRTQGAKRPAGRSLLSTCLAHGCGEAA